MVFMMGIMALLVGLGMIIHIVYEHYFGYTVGLMLNEVIPSAASVIIFDSGYLDFPCIRVISEYAGGSEIVYGVRNSRNTDGFFKKSSATLLLLYDIRICRHPAPYFGTAHPAGTPLLSYLPES